MRRPLIAGNWKMHRTVGEALALARGVRSGLETQPAPNVDVVICPPYTTLFAVAQDVRGSDISVGGQDLHWEKEGAYTGAISGPLLKDAGCTYVIVGHSERRELFGEKDDDVLRKARAAVDHGLTPILCVGETLVEREAGRTLAVVERELEAALRKLRPAEAARSLIAYEPMWAIGTGKTATPAQAQEVHAFIRRQVARSHGDDVAAAIRILYGGSVKPDNAAAIMAEADVDGALVGGACLDAGSFLSIINFRK